MSNSDTRDKDWILNVELVPGWSQAPSAEWVSCSHRECRRLVHPAVGLYQLVHISIRSGPFKHPSFLIYWKSLTLHRLPKPLGVYEVAVSRSLFLCLYLAERQRETETQRERDRKETGEKRPQYKSDAKIDLHFHILYILHPSENSLIMSHEVNVV